MIQATVLPTNHGLPLWNEFPCLWRAGGVRLENGDPMSNQTFWATVPSLIDGPSRTRESLTDVPNLIGSRRPFLELDDLLFNRPDGGGCAVRDVQLAKNVLNVFLHRFDADAARVGDLFVA